MRLSGHDTGPARMAEPLPESRLVFDPAQRRIGVRVGKVELGQHVGAAFRTIVALALGVSDDVVAILPVTTYDSPDDGLTVGSLSVQVTGVALRAATLQWAERLRIAAGLRLNAEPQETRLDPDRLVFQSGDAMCDLFDLVPQDAIGDVSPGREDWVAGVTSGRTRFIQDLELPRMLHGRALRGRSVSGVLPEGATLIEDGGFSAIVLPSEGALAHIWSRVEPPEVPDVAGATDCDGPVRDWLRSRRVLTTGEGASPTEGAVAVSTSRPFLLHGAIAPACALARIQDGILTVWTHSQGIFPLREQIARVLGLDPDTVELVFVPSSGCYGHTAADDAAMDAALIAYHLPGRAIRVLWPREDEVRFGPVGAPMLTETHALMDDAGRIVAWRHEIWSAPHGQRPGGGGNVNLLAATERDPGLRTGDVADLPAAIGAGAARNAVPLYALPDVAVTTHVVQDLPVRTSSLRGLGTQMNTVAIEAMMDRLATERQECPFAFRLRHLDDPRAVAVLEALRRRTESARTEIEGRDDAAIGIALGRYKNSAAYAAVAASVLLEDAPRVADIWAVVDAGEVVSEDGARNQIEGGILQAVSWTLFEGVLLRQGHLDAKGWEDYPVLPWSQVPALHVDLVEEAGHPPLGVGECMVGPVSAALVNGVARIVGLTLADLPLDRDTIISGLA